MPRIAGFIPESVVDGPGVRSVLFFQGCPHRCENCHNPHTWDPEGGAQVKWNEVTDMIKSVARYTAGLTVSGGEPFEQVLQLNAILRWYKQEYPDKDVIVYTGYTYNQLIKKADDDKNIMDVLKLTDYLVDGPFVSDKKQPDLFGVGSCNQHVLTLKNGQVVRSNNCFVDVQG